MIQEEYEEPRVLQMPVAEKPSQIDYSSMISIITAWKDILNARLLALLALVGGLVVFGFAMYDPSNLRLTGASLYCMGILWPVMALFMRKG